MTRTLRRSDPSPSPLVGEGRGGGAHDSGTGATQFATPTPDPSPQGGGEKNGCGSGRLANFGVAGDAVVVPPPLATETTDRCNGALYRLMTWMSPAYPIGAFAYSGGIEWAVEARDITDAASLVAWIATLLRHGSLFGDAVIFGHAHRAATCGADQALAEIAELAAALAGTKERFLETTAQGAAFMEITKTTWPCTALDRLTEYWERPITYPVAAGVACAGHGIAAAPALQAFLHGAASNLVSAGVRLVPFGQTDGQRIVAMLEAPVAQAAERALAAGPDDWGTATLRADIAAMRHETQYTRLFRS
jgi:urease accessory protein